MHKVQVHKELKFNTEPLRNPDADFLLEHGTVIESRVEEPLGWSYKKVQYEGHIYEVWNTTTYGARLWQRSTLQTGRWYYYSTEGEKVFFAEGDEHIHEMGRFDTPYIFIE